MRTIERVNNEEDAYDLEKRYIKKFRKLGYRLMNCTYGGPEEAPMKINKPKKEKTQGIKLPVLKKKTAAKKIIKKKR